MTLTAWRSAEAEAHAAKAEALEHAADALNACNGVVDAITWNVLVNTQHLCAEIAQHHNERAALLREGER